MKHPHHSEHLAENATGTIPLIQHSVSSLIHGVVSIGGATAELAGEVAAGTVKIAGRGVRSFLQKIFH